MGLSKKKSINYIFDKPEQMFASSVAKFAKVSNFLGLTWNIEINI